MNGTDPWISDLRRSTYHHSVSRTGLPALPQYSLRSFRLFVGKIWVTFLLVVATISVLYCGKVLRSPKMNVTPKADYHLQLQDEPSTLMIVSDYLDTHVLLSEIFSQDPDIFFSIHPLTAVMDDCMQLTSEKVKADYLHKHFRCSIMNQSRIFTEVGLSTNPQSHDSPLQECLHENFCYRKQNPRLCTGSLCNYAQVSTDCESCGPVDVQAAAHYCQASRLRAIGVGHQSCGFECLDKLVNHHDLNLKIVVFNCDCCNVIKPSCPDSTENLDDPLEAFEYLLLKHEDLQRNPEDVVREICDYVGYSSAQTASMCNNYNKSKNRNIRKRRRRRGLRRVSAKVRN